MINQSSVVRELLAGGIAGLAVVACFVVIRAVLEGADSGDWLGFAGAVIGTGLAVGGAVWIEHYKRDMVRDEGTKALLHAAFEIEMALNLARLPFHAVSLTARVSEILQRKSRLSTAKEFSLFILNRYPPPPTLHWQRLQIAHEAIDRLQGIKYSHFDHHAGEELCSVESVSIWFQEAEIIADPIVPIVRVMINEIQAGVLPEVIRVIV